MIKLKEILTEASQNAGSYSADSGEPDTGFIHGGKKRQLGKLSGKPEPWFESGGYTQLQFPTADYIYGKGFEGDFVVVKTIKEDIKLKNIITEARMLSVFDFDDTLAKSDSWVYVMLNGKEVDKLDPAEFAIHDGLKQGEEYDFRDFDKKLRNPKIIKKNIDLLRKQLKKGGRKVTILTARRLGAPINHFFRTIGINPYVVPLGSADPKKKADWIEAEIIKGYNPIYFMDDSPKNIKAVNTLKKKYPDTKIVTRLVK